MLCIVGGSVTTPNRSFVLGWEHGFSWCVVPGMEKLEVMGINFLMNYFLSK